MRNDFSQNRGRVGGHPSSRLFRVCIFFDLFKESIDFERISASCSFCCCCFCLELKTEQFEGWRYRVLRSGHPAFQTEDGSYLDKLALDDVSVAHSGLYICIATNTAGYTYREASVNVISGKPRLFLFIARRLFEIFLLICI